MWFNIWCFVLFIPGIGLVPAPSPVQLELKDGEKVREAACIGGELILGVGNYHRPQLVCFQPETAQVRKNVFPYKGKGRGHIHAVSGRLVTFDLTRREIQIYREDGALDLRLSTGLSAPVDLGMFQNGRFISINAMATPRPVFFDEVEDPEEAQGFLSDIVRLAHYNLFYQNEHYAVIKPLAELDYLQHPFEEPDKIKSFKSLYRVRMSTDALHAVVFSINLPEILVFNQEGEQIAVIDHPGEGLIAQPYPDRDPLPVRYQSDVLYHDGGPGLPPHIVVSDSVNQVLRILTPEGEQIDEVPVDTRIDFLASERRTLYGVSMSGEVRRWRYSGSR